MTGLDFAVLGVLLFSMLIGAWRGVIREVCAIAAWVGGVGAAWLYGETLTKLISNVIPNAGIATVAGYLIAFIVANLLISLISWGLRSLFKAAGLSFLDRGVGVGFGALRGALIMVVLATIAGLTRIPEEAWWREALTAKPLETVVMICRQWMPESIAKRVSFQPRSNV